MAHELHKDVTNQTRMFSVGKEEHKRPWHANETSPIIYAEAPTIEQVIKDLRADVKIELRPLFDQYGHLDPNVQQVFRPHIDADGNQLFNVDNSPAGDNLGYVGKKYEVIQDWELVEFARPWIENELGTLETGGAIADGKTFWILVKLKLPPSEIQKYDIVEHYILISNSHGTDSCLVLPSEIRVVCKNTLGAAHRAAKKMMSIRHHGNVALKLDAVQKLMLKYSEVFQKNQELYKEMVKYQLTLSQANNFLERVLRPKSEEKTEGLELLELEEQKEVKLTESKIYRTIMNEMVLDKQELGYSSANLWGIYNGLTAFVTHHSAGTLSGRIQKMYSSRNVATAGLEMAKNVLAGKVNLDKQVRVSVPARVSA